MMCGAQDSMLAAAIHFSPTRVSLLRPVLSMRNMIISGVSLCHRLPGPRGQIVIAIMWHMRSALLA